MDNNMLDIVVTLVDEASAGITELEGKVAALEEQQKRAASASSSMGATVKSMGSTLMSTGGALTAGITLPIVGIGIAAGKMATTFQQKMEILHTEAGVPQAALKALGESILNLSKSVGIGPEALANAMYHIESNGKGLITTAQALDQLKISAEAAAMTGADLDSTTYALSSTLASGITGVHSYTEMMGVLNGIVGAGDMRFQDLNGAISTGFIPTAAQFGITIQSLGAALATLTDNGESAQEAATRLRMSIALMSAPTAQAAKVLGALGLSGGEVKAATEAATQALQDAHVSTTKLADDLRKPDGINVALMDLKKHLEASGLSANAADAALSKAFGGGRSDAAILTLLHNTERTSEAFKQINKTSKDFAADWGAQQQTFKQKFSDAWASIQASLIRLGGEVLPYVAVAFERIADGVARVAAWFEKLTPAQKQLVAFGLIFGALLGPIMLVTGAILGFVAAVLTVGAPAIIAVGAITALTAAGAALIVWWRPLQPFMKGLWDGIKGIFDYEMGWMKVWLNAFLAIPKAIMGAWNGVTGFMQKVGDSIKNATDAKSVLAHAGIKIPGFASGVQNFGGGLAIVGEQGPELVNLPSGSSVIPNGQTGQMGGAVTNIYGNINLGDSSAVEAFFRRIGRNQELARHGITPAGY